MDLFCFHVKEVWRAIVRALPPLGTQAPRFLLLFLKNAFDLTLQGEFSCFNHLIGFPVSRKRKKKKPISTLYMLLRSYTWLPICQERPRNVLLGWGMCHWKLVLLFVKKDRPVLGQSNCQFPSQVVLKCKNC